MPMSANRGAADFATARCGLADGSGGNNASKSTPHLIAA
jgi:hypothetical protein